MAHRHLVIGYRDVHGNQSVTRTFGLLDEDTKVWRYGRGSGYLTASHGRRRIAITLSRYGARMRKEHTRREILAGVATVPGASVAEPKLSVFDWLEEVELSASIWPAGSKPQVSKPPDQEETRPRATSRPRCHAAKPGRLD